MIFSRKIISLLLCLKWKNDPLRSSLGYIPEKDLIVFSFSMKTSNFMCDLVSLRNSSKIFGDRMLQLRSLVNDIVPSYENNEKILLDGKSFNNSISFSDTVTYGDLNSIFELAKHYKDPTSFKNSCPFAYKFEEYYKKSINLLINDYFEISQTVLYLYLEEKPQDKETKEIQSLHINNLVSIIKNQTEIVSLIKNDTDFVNLNNISGFSFSLDKKNMVLWVGVNILEIPNKNASLQKKILTSLLKNSCFSDNHFLVASSRSFFIEEAGGL